MMSLLLAVTLYQNMTAVAIKILNGEHFELSKHSIELYDLVMLRTENDFILFFCHKNLAYANILNFLFSETVIK